MNEQLRVSSGKYDDGKSFDEFSMEEAIRGNDEPIEIFEQFGYDFGKVTYPEELIRMMARNMKTALDEIKRKEQEFKEKKNGMRHTP